MKNKAVPISPFLYLFSNGPLCCKNSLIEKKRGKFMKFKLAILIVLELISSAALADQWSQAVNISKVEPLVNWNGGMIRVIPSTASTNPANCGLGTVYDFTYDAGTQEIRSATVSALYMAFTTGKKIRFYIDSTKCSLGGSPIIRGVQLEQ